MESGNTFSQLKMIRQRSETEEQFLGSAHKRAKVTDISAEKKIFHDTIYGQIELHPLLVKIIDTPQFQRLRYIKQLGTKHLIFPGATHTRFEHSLGVAHLAGRMIKHLHAEQPELNITKQEILCVEIAGLCHDLGHGPFSHLFDGMFIPEVQSEKWEHEEASVEMLNHILKRYVMKDMKAYGLNEDDIDFIGKLIRGVKTVGDEWTEKGAEDKSFLYEIVSNKRNGIDVDKWDYIVRDCHHLGLPNGFDPERLLKSARVCQVNIGENKQPWLSICYRDKIAHNIYDMFHTRYTLHRQALQHKIGYIIDVQVTEALVGANHTIDTLRISDAKNNIVEYTKLTDHIIYKILHSDSDLNNDLDGAKEKLKQIVSRHLPTFVGEARLDEDKFEKELERQEEQLNVQDLNEVKQEKQRLRKELEREQQKERKLELEKLLKEKQWKVEKLKIHQEEQELKNQLNEKQRKVEKLKNQHQEVEGQRKQEILIEASEMEIRLRERPQIDALLKQEQLIEKCLKDEESKYQQLKEEQEKRKNMKLDKYKQMKRMDYQKILEEHWKATGDPNLEWKIYVVDMGFGKVGKTPIDNVYFYNKTDPNKAFKMAKNEMSSLKPKRFHEWIVRLYYTNTKSDYQNVQQKLEDSFHKWCMKSDYVLKKSPSDEPSRVESSGDKTSGVKSSENHKTFPNKIFNDCVHGHIELHPLLVKIIDTPQFQRLRYIKQLGGKYLVFPGATHTRFEHSIGAAHLAEHLAKILQEKQKNISQKDILCVQIAALCYNLGRGPLSHVFDEKIMPKTPQRNEPWKPQMASVWMFLDIMEKMKQKDLDVDDIIFICKLIQGDDASEVSPEWRPGKIRSEKKTFLYEIVNNTQNGIDVRRWDYFARDCHHLGLSNSFDYQHLMKFAKVCKVDGKEHICFRDKVADNVYDMFHTRYNLYRQVYQHKTGNIIEDKITEAITKEFIKKEWFSQITENDLKADIESKMKGIINGSSEQKAQTSVKIEKYMEMYIQFTDDIFEDTLYTSEDERKHGRMILEDVVSRHLPKCVGEARLPVYKKDTVTYKQELQVSSLLPEKFEEQLLRVYYKKKPNELTEDAVKCFKEWCSCDFGLFDYIIFYEHENFKGKSYTCKDKFPELHKHLKQCQSIRVERGTWEVFDEHQCRRQTSILIKGRKRNFPIDPYSCKIRFCEIQLFEQFDLSGNSHVISKECDSLENCYGISEVYSCRVIAGTWKLYEGPDHTEEEYQVEEGEYLSYENWGAQNPNVKSLKPK